MAKGTVLDRNVNIVEGKAIVQETTEVTMSRGDVMQQIQGLEMQKEQYKAQSQNIKTQYDGLEAQIATLQEILTQLSETTIEVI